MVETVYGTHCSHPRSSLLTQRPAGRKPRAAATSVWAPFRPCSVPDMAYAPVSMEEQAVTMMASIRTIEGIGPQVVDIFETAGFRTVKQLNEFNAEDRLIWDTICEKKTRDVRCLASGYWQRLMTRCMNVIYRARSAEADDFVPYEYMCPISLDWFQDPVVLSSGHSYSRAFIVEHFTLSDIEPTTGEKVTNTDVTANIALRHVVQHYRLHHQRFRILL